MEHYYLNMKYSITSLFYNRIFLFLISYILFFNGCTSVKEEKKSPDVYESLEIVLNERKQQLIHYMSETQNLAKKASTDENMLGFFKTKKEFYYLSKSNKLPDQLVNEIEKLKANIQNYYIMNYIAFYDILFIDTQGVIFYTIRKQADYHKNIFEGELAKTELSQKLKLRPKESFVDFQFFEISGEPSAFFIEPVFEDKMMIGWMVMQNSINNINTLFSDNKNMGLTGEVVLVNKDHYLLTDSRFNPGHTYFKQKLPEENIDSKFKERKGRKDVIDYRGKSVISAFEVFDFFDSEWLLIAKIDNSEVLTQNYKQNEEILYSEIDKMLKVKKWNYIDYFPASVSRTEVDMDEYQRADTSSILYTRGVSTCTTLIISYPGRFAYMAHISPKDYVYGETNTDLVNQLMNKVAYFDIKPVDKPKLKFYLASTRSTSFRKIIQIILNNGYFLNQINVLYNPAANYGNVNFDVSTSSGFVNWRKHGNVEEIIGQDFNDALLLENVFLKKQ